MGAPGGTGAGLGGFQGAATSMGLERSDGRARSFVSDYAIFLVFIGLLMAGALTSPQFMTWDNMRNTLQSVAFTGFAALGMLFVTTGGGFVDLSIPATIAASGIIALAFQPTLGVVGGIVAGIGVGGLIGVTNGFFIGILGANPVIITLGMQVIGIGVAQIFTGGGIVYNTDAAFAEIGKGTFFGILPNTLLILGLAILVAHVLLAHTVLGRWVHTTGGNYAASRAAGVPVRRVMVTVFTLCGLFAAVGGVLLASVLDSARGNAGAGYEFNAIAAVAIGGNSLFGGFGTVPRVIIGVLIVGVLNNLMVLLGVPVESQNIVKGALIAGAALLDVRLRRQAVR